MTFKEIKQGYPVYILHKGSCITSSVGKAVVVSNPRFQAPTQPVTNPFATTSTQVVDVTVEEEGQQKTYTIPESLDVTFAGQDMVLATSKDAILREVEAIKAKAESELSKMDKYRKDVKECDAVIAELNPEIRAKQENDARLGSLETDMRDMKAMMKDLIDKLK